jgi:hypothetical protein
MFGSGVIHTFTSGICPEMEFLDINLTRRLESFAPCYSQSLSLRILQANIPYTGIKNPGKKIRETRKLDSVHEKHVVEWKKEGRKIRQKVESEKTQVLCPEFLTKNVVQDFHL